MAMMAVSLLVSRWRSRRRSGRFGREGSTRYRRFFGVMKP